MMLSPGRFLGTVGLALRTSRPGLRGHLYQSFYFVEAILAADILRRNLIEHVHNHIGDQSGTVTMLAAHLAGIEYSITFHGWPVFFDAKDSRIKEKVMRARFVRAIGYFCRSQLIMFSECNDLDQFKVVHCGVTISNYRYRPPRKPVRTLFCATRLSREKGLQFLIHAMAALLKQGHDLELRLGGDGPAKAELQQLATEMGLSDRVHFLGYLTEDGVVRELDSSDLFVLPSFAEGIPVSAMEAMAIGVPVIATNIAGTSELVEDGKTGLLVRPSDAEALANAIIRMIGDHAFRLSAADLARQKVVEEFDVDKETSKLKDHFLDHAESSVRQGQARASRPFRLARQQASKD
jgi:glycosyltransferase involved in cell wall biosynthesis